MDALNVGVPLIVVLGLLKLLEALVAKLNNGSTPSTKHQYWEMQEKIDRLDRLLVDIKNDASLTVNLQKRFLNQSAQKIEGESNV